MTSFGWLALAAAVAIGGPASLPARIDALAGGGRLVVAPAGRIELRPAALPWRAIAALAVGGAVLGAGAVAGPLLAAAAGAVFWTASVVVRGGFAARAANLRRTHLLATMRVLIAELEAGARPAAALAAAGEASPTFDAVFAAAAKAAGAGDDAGAVLIGNGTTRPIGLAWQLGEDTGVALAGVLSRVAADLAAEDEQQRTVAVALAGPRSSAFVLSGLPLVGIGLGAAMGARPLDFLVAAGPGRAVCCVGVLLDVAGVLWMRRILRRAEQS